MEEAEKAIGDYKLKTSSIFNLLEERGTLFSKYEELLNCRKKVCTSVNIYEGYQKFFLIGL